jgi:hypothetical protein
VKVWWEFQPLSCWGGLKKNFRPKQKEEQESQEYRTKGGLDRLEHLAEEHGQGERRDERLVEMIFVGDREERNEQKG